MTEGFEAVTELKREGRIGAVSFGVYPIALWQRILCTLDIDVALVHNHYCLNDTQLLDLLPIVRAKGIGLINGAPFASGLLTDRGAPAWHPACADDRAAFRRAVGFCRKQGLSLSRLALQFASQNPEIPTTLFSSANPQCVAGNVRWCEEPYDAALLREVWRTLEPVRNKEWVYV
jgi:aryl-alcohol dehydrogenase-like predicted oxidoreductase